MKILTYCHNDDGQLQSTLRQRLSNHQLFDYNDDTPIPKSSIEAAIVNSPPSDFFDGLDNLRHAYTISAGVDHLLNHPGLPAEVSIVRLCDAGMAPQMAEYVLYGVLHAQRQMHEFRLVQSSGQWQNDIPVKSAANTHVGILGAGALGAQVAQRLAANGFSVCCWSRTPHSLGEGITGAHGESALPEFLSHCDVLVCMLPLTDATRGILGANLFKHLARGAYLINPARGAHLVDDDLLHALDEYQLSGAMLDVFNEEPLPPEHPFWQHPRIIVTPHVAAKSLVNESVDQIVSSINSVENGELPAGLVDRQHGY